MILIGSQAMAHLGISQERLEKADFDVIMSPEDFYKWTERYDKFIKSLVPKGENKYKAIIVKDGKKTQYEIELGFDGTSSKFLLDNLYSVTYLFSTDVLGDLYNVLSPKYQMLTKKSHIVYPVHWEKNISDYHFLKECLGDFNLIDRMKEYFELRNNEAKERYKKFKTPKLNVTNEDFFSSKLAVDHYFVHDDIHEMVKHHERPVYEMMKSNFDSAWCEKDKFFALPYDYQIQCVQEEAMAIALERYIVPQAAGWDDYFDCYHKSVKRISTTLCSGWFRTFAIENYPTIIARYNPNFVQEFRAKVDSGEIKPYEGKTLADIPDFHIGGK